MSVEVGRHQGHADRPVVRDERDHAVPGQQLRPRQAEVSLDPGARHARVPLDGRPAEVEIAFDPQAARLQVADLAALQDEPRSRGVRGVDPVGERAAIGAQPAGETRAVQIQTALDGGVAQLDPAPRAGRLLDERLAQPVGRDRLVVRQDDRLPGRGGVAKPVLERRRGRHRPASQQVTGRERQGELDVGGGRSIGSRPYPR